MLLMAAKAYDVTGLGYLGADIVLDKGKGPAAAGTERPSRPRHSDWQTEWVCGRLSKPALTADTEGLNAEQAASCSARSSTGSTRPRPTC
jgi:hypothetical protein